MFYNLQKEKENLCIEIMSIIQKSNNNSILLSDIKSEYNIIESFINDNYDLKIHILTEENLQKIYNESFGKISINGLYAIDEIPNEYTKRYIFIRYTTEHITDVYYRSMLHEITHAIDDYNSKYKISNTNNYTETSYEHYCNKLIEINARISAYLPTQEYKIDKIISEFKNNIDFDRITNEKYKRKIFKKLFIYLDNEGKIK